MLVGGAFLDKVVHHEFLEASHCGGICLRPFSLGNQFGGIILLVPELLLSYNEPVIEENAYSDYEYNRYNNRNYGYGAFVALQFGVIL